MKKFLCLLFILQGTLGYNDQFVHAGDSITIDVGTVLGNIPPYFSGSCLEDVNHEIYGGLFGQRLYGESFEEPAPEDGLQISRQWKEYAAGDAEREFRLMTDNPYNGKQYQRISARGYKSSRTGLWNMGLNGWGIPVCASKPMTGYVCLRSGSSARVFVALQSSDGSKTYCSKRLHSVSSDWKRFDFALTPSCSDSLARFCVFIEGPGTLDVDISCLYEHRSKWCGPYPFRKDIADAMVNEGLTILRYGGTMVNSPQYRTSVMLQSRDKRPSYNQAWNEYGSHGFAIEEFMQLCEYCGFLPAVAIPAQDDPKSIANLVEYLNAPAGRGLGKLRAKNGHPKPYGLKWLEVGNEEAIFAKGENIPVEYDLYIERFNAIYDAVRKVDTSIVFICSAWWRQQLPEQMEKIFKTLDGKASMWDYHPYADALTCNVKAEDGISKMDEFFHKWNPDTKMKCVIFEENGDTHGLKRALGHALIQNLARRHGDFIVACCAANALQPWQQHDTHWDQGQIFFTPTRVWHMPPSYVTRMLSDAYQQLLIASSCDVPLLDVVATIDNERKCVTLLVVNKSNQPVVAAIDIKGGGEYREFKMKTITGQLGDENTPEEPQKLVPINIEAGPATEFPAYSFSVLTIKQP